MNKYEMSVPFDQFALGGKQRSSTTSLSHTERIFNAEQISVLHNGWSVFWWRQRRLLIRGFSFIWRC